MDDPDARDDRSSCPTAAGRAIGGLPLSLLRYCGLPWDGHPPETWSFEYFDRVPTGDHPNRIDPVDVLSAGALHAGLSRADLAYFIDHADEIAAWLDQAPTDVRLHEATAAQRAHLKELPTVGGAQLSLLTKVLHRKRPALVPMLDRPLIDRYRPVTGERNAAAAWVPLVDAIAADLAEDPNSVYFEVLRRTMENETGVPISRLRLFDIALWMEGR